MPPKKDAAPANITIEGYDVKETRILAAAFLSSLGADKYDWPLFAKLTGFTEGSLKKFWPPVKNKAIEQTESFATFLKGAGAAATPPKAAAGGKKRKAADADADLDPKASSADTADSKAPEGKTKKAPAKKRGKKAKTEEVEEQKVKEEDNSTDGGDGLDEV